MNNCYLNSLYNCLEFLGQKVPELGVDFIHMLNTGDGIITSIWDFSTGNQEDAHEFFVKLCEIFPKRYSSVFEISYEDKSSLYYLPITTDNTIARENVSSVPKIVCVNRIPTNTNIQNFDKLEIDIHVEDQIINNYYNFICGICYSGNGKHGHYISVRKIGEKYIGIDGDHKFEIDQNQNIYMLFYLRM